MNSSPFIELEWPLPYSQKSANGQCPEPDKSTLLSLQLFMFHALRQVTIHTPNNCTIFSHNHVHICDNLPTCLYIIVPHHCTVVGIEMMKATRYITFLTLHLHRQLHLCNSPFPGGLPTKLHAFIISPKRSQPFPLNIFILFWCFVDRASQYIYLSI